MILDSSAVVAILAGEEEGPDFVRAIAAAARVSMSTSTALEVSLVGRSGRSRAVNAWIEEAGVRLVPFDRTHLTVAQRAHATYGKGRGHPAQLNFGDCMSYALAKVSGEPLLFKGADFTHTDITPAWLPEVS